MGATYKYKAFVSYARPDAQVAKLLQRRLETYVLPSAVRTIQPGARFDRRPVRPVFRDEDELVPGQDLPGRIHEGLKASEYLIVICSPAGHRSPWVQREVEEFIQLGRRDRILAIVVDGEPDTGKRGLPSDRECLPDALISTAAGGASNPAQSEEVLWVDWRTQGASERVTFLRIVAALLAFDSLDQLIQRDARRRKRNLILTAAAAMLFVVGATGAIWNSRAQSRKLADTGKQFDSERFTREAEKFVSLGQYAEAFDSAYKAFQVSPTPSDAARAAIAHAFPQPMRTLSGHTDIVYNAAFSPDGRSIVTASKDGTARVWDAVTGEAFRTFDSHSGPVWSAAFSPEGKRVLTRNDDKAARVWDIQSGKLIATLKGHTQHIYGAAFSPDGQYVATSSDDFTARIWNAGTGQLIRTLNGHDGGVLSVAFSPSDGKAILTASMDHTARLWNAVDGALIKELKGHTRPVCSAAFSPDGKSIVTASMDGDARVWNVATGKSEVLPAESLNDSSCNVYSAVFSSNSESVAMQGSDGKTRVWSGLGVHTLEAPGDEVNHPDERSTANGPVYRLLDEPTGIFYRPAYSPDGKFVIAASGFHTAQIWNAETRKIVARLDAHSDRILSTAFSPDGQFAVTASADKSARVWSLAAPYLIRQLGERDYNSSDAGNAVFLPPDGTRVATWSRPDKDRFVQIWSAADGRPLLKLDGDGGSNPAGMFSRDGKKVVTAGNDGTATIWDTVTGRSIRKLETEVAAGDFSSDQRLVTVGYDQIARVWNVSGGPPVATLTGTSKAINTAAFSPDGKYVVTAGSDGSSVVWNASTGEKLGTLDYHSDNITGAAFSSDGKVVRTVRDGGGWRVWSFPDAQVVAEAPGNVAGYAYLRSSVFSPDGKFVVWRNGANMFCLFNLARQDWLNPDLSAGGDGITAASFSPDGRRLVTDTGYVALIWDVTTGQKIAQFDHSAFSHSVAFSPDGHRVVVPGSIFQIFTLADIDRLLATK